MTVSSLTVKNSYNGDNTTTSFSFTFPIHGGNELKVIERSALGVETVKTLNTHYTLVDNGASGGTVTFGTAPAQGTTIVLLRDTSLTQEVDYVSNDPFPAETHEGALDKLTLQVQEVQEEVNRSLKISRTNTMTNTEFTTSPTDRASKVLSFDSSGELAVTQELGEFKGNWSASTSYAVRDLVKDTSTNNIFIALTAHTSSGTQPLTTNTDSSKWSLIIDAAASATSATASANSATASANSATASANSATASANSASAASTSETNAATSASTSSTQATNSANSATASANSANAALGSANAAAATFDLFDDAFLGAKSSNPSIDNDGNALQDGALYFDTTNDVMKVYNLSSTTWLQLTPTVTNQNNINSAVANASNINAAVANENNINAAVSNQSNINAAVSNASNINAVAGISTEITNVNNNQSNINSVNSNSGNINLTAGSIANVNNVGNSIASVNTAASNLNSINSFANTYLGAASSAPTQDPDGSSLDLGDLYFDTGSNQLKVYSSTGWVNAGSSVNGTSDRFKYTISGTPTTVSGNDDNSKSLSYDAGFIDVFLNGIKMVNGTDVTVTSGNSVVFASALTNGDVVDIITFGTFNIASMNASNLTSGTVPDARITGTYTGITGLDVNGTVTSTRLSLGDNNKLHLGASNDLEIFHDGSNSIINEAGTGQLVLRTDGTQVSINKGTSENMAKFIVDGACELYHDNSKKFETTSTGATVTGKFNVSSNIADFAIKSENTTHNARVDIIASGSNKNSILNFGDGASSTVGYIDYDHADNSLRFATSATERMRLDSSGNVFVKKSSSDGGVVGVELLSSGAVFATRDNNFPLFLNRTSSDGQLILFRKDGSTVGSIGSHNGDKIIIGSFGGSNPAGLKFQTQSAPFVAPCTSTGANSDNVQNLGHTSARWKDLYLSGGAFIGGTGTANKLDDYEEGTFTPSFTSGVTGSNYDHQTGRYTKIGNKVFIEIQLDGNGLSGTGGHLKIGGLPFTSNSSAPYGGVTFGYNAGFKTDGNMTFNKGSNSTTLDGYNWDGSTLLGNETNNINASILISGSYTTA